MSIPLTPSPFVQFITVVLSLFSDLVSIEGVILDTPLGRCVTHKSRTFPVIHLKQSLSYYFYLPCIIFFSVTSRHSSSLLYEKFFLIWFWFTSLTYFVLFASRDWMMPLSPLGSILSYPRCTIHCLFSSLFHPSSSCHTFLSHY